jgi:hypothetical protein
MLRAELGCAFVPCFIASDLFTLGRRASLPSNKNTNTRSILCIYARTHEKKAQQAAG